MPSTLKSVFANFFSSPNTLCPKIKVRNGLSSNLLGAIKSAEELNVRPFERIANFASVNGKVSIKLT